MLSNMKNKSKVIFLATGWLVVILLLVNFHRQSINPYGWVFWSQLFVAIFLAVILLVLWAINCFRSKNRFKALLIYAIGLTTLLVANLIYYDYRIVLFPDSLKALSKSEWSNDIKYLKNTLKKKHPNVNELIEEKQLDSVFAHLDSKLDTWNDTQIKLELMKIVSLLNDGHSIIPPQPSINLHCLPFVAHKFNDGVYVIDAARDYAHLNNAEVVKINNHLIEDVFKKLKPYIGIENEGGEWDRFPLYGSITELLFQLQITNDPLSAKVTFMKDGETFTETIKGKSYYQWFYFYFSPNRENNALPYEHRLLDKNYWFTYDESSQNLYVNINNLKDDSSESIKQFSNRLVEFTDTNSINKTILDLRNNRGGDNFKARALLKVFRDQKKVNKHGKFFTLISRRTFSAGVNLATLLENQTKTIFIGEPTGQGPTQFGDAKGYKLPNSGIHFFTLTGSRYWSFYLLIFDYFLLN